MNASHKYDLFGASPAIIAVPAAIDDIKDIVKANTPCAIVPWGGGTRQHVGYAPAKYDVALDVTDLNHIVEYHPDDMVVIAEAGMTAEALQMVLAENRQFLPLQIAEPEKQTIGGMVAARSDSLLRFGFGSVRDCLIGVNVINADGDLVKGGGKVVKNVAGYDLPKLYCGSYGTLGVIVQAGFKVSPLPEVSQTAIIELPANRSNEDILDSILMSGIAPSFLYLVNPSVAAYLDYIRQAGNTPGNQLIIVGFDGLKAAVDWQYKSLNALLDSSNTIAGMLEDDISCQIRSLLRDFPNRTAPLCVSYHIQSSQVGAYIRMVEWTARRDGYNAMIAADAAVGIMWAQFEPADGCSDWNTFYLNLCEKAIRCGGSFIFERIPNELRNIEVPVWEPLLPDLELMKGLKNALDPNCVWNPGRFVGRI